jgi:hypothetical protein
MVIWKLEKNCNFNLAPSRSGPYGSEVTESFLTYKIKTGDAEGTKGEEENRR